jgi:hydrophobic/amphiphilic exporter-1 (mainly G- bacteria), HAE1 family
VQLTRLADPGITKALRGVSGVASVTVRGGVEREMTVQLDPNAMQAAGVSVGAGRAGAVRAEPRGAGRPRHGRAGRADDPAARPARDARGVRADGRLPAGDQIVRLGQVARVFDGAEEPRSLALFDATEAIGIDIVKARGYSTTEVSEAVQHKLEEIQAALPPDAKLSVVVDKGERVEQSVHNVQKALIEGALLTVLVVFLFLNSWRSTVITGLALPVSVLAAFAAVWAFGFTLNTMSLMGLSLAIGILIDDAIVVRENIVRHVEMGKDHYTAAREGTAEIGLAVAATTFSIVAVFVPIAFMYGMAGQWFKPFALTIASSVLVSLFVSFSLDPMLSAYWPIRIARSTRRAGSRRSSTASMRGSMRRRRAISGDRLGARSPHGHGAHCDGIVRRRHRSPGDGRRRRVLRRERQRRDDDRRRNTAGIEPGVHAAQGG